MQYSITQPNCGCYITVQTEYTVPVLLPSLCSCPPLAQGHRNVLPIPKLRIKILVAAVCRSHVEPFCSPPVRPSLLLEPFCALLIISILFPTFCWQLCYIYLFLLFMEFFFFSFSSILIQTGDHIKRGRFFPLFCSLVVVEHTPQLIPQPYISIAIKIP